MYLAFADAGTSRQTASQFSPFSSTQGGAFPGDSGQQAKLTLQEKPPAQGTSLAEPPLPARQLPADIAQLIHTLRHQARGLKAPLTGRLGDILILFKSLKAAETNLTRLLRDWPDHAEVSSLSHHLSCFIGRFVHALESSDATMQLDIADLTHESVQICCQGLAVCAPTTGATLWQAPQDKPCHATLQKLTDVLLKRAMSLGLPDSVQANGEVLCILNWVSRGLKAGLLMASPAVSKLFQRSLLLIEAWTGGDQCRQLLTDHNLGRCAVQVNTLINHIPLDWHETLSDRPGKPESQGDLLQRCILNLCSEAVLKRLTTKPIDTVSLLNVCNLIKDGLSERRLSIRNPSLLPSLARLVSAIGRIPYQDLYGDYSDCRPLSNLANFVRTLCEYRVGQDLVFALALPALDDTCDHLIACINDDLFAEAFPGPQALSNLISFVKLCDKRMDKAALASVLPTSTASSSSELPVSTHPDAEATSRQRLVSASRRLVQGLIEQAPDQHAHNKAISGLLAGLTYLWQRNLVPHSLELKSYVAKLFVQATQLPAASWPEQSRAVLMTALVGMLGSGLASEAAVQPLFQSLMPQHPAGKPITANDLRAAMKQLGAVEETIEPLPIMPVVVATPVASSTAVRPRIIPGLTAVRNEPVPVEPPKSSTGTPASRRAQAPGHGDTASEDWQAPKKTVKPATTQATAQHSEPTMVVKMAAAKKSSPPKIAPAKNAPSTSHQPKSEAAASNSAASNLRKGTNAKGKSGKGKAAPAGKAVQTVEAAILSGDGKRLDQLLKQAPTWTAGRILAVLDVVQADVLLYDNNLIAALDRFLEVALPKIDGQARSALTEQLTAQPPQALAVENLLKKHALLELEKPIQESTDLVTKDVDGNIPLFTAIQSKNAAAIKRFLSDPSAVAQSVVKDKAGWNALMLAAHFGDAETVELLLTLSTANLQCVSCTDDGFNALMEAAGQGHAKVTELLLAQPTRLEQSVATVRTGRNALMFATECGHVEIVKQLLSLSTARQQTTTRGKDGITALVIAATSGKAEIVQQLLSQKNAVEQMSLMIKGKVTPLMLAAGHGFDTVVECFLAHPFGEEYAKAMSDDGWNALMFAADSGHTKIFKRLLALPTGLAQATVEDSNGMSALTIAAGRGHSNIVSLLLAQRASIPGDTDSKDWWYALTGAAVRGHAKVVVQLLAHQGAGSRHLISMPQGLIIIAMVREQGNQEILELLERAM